VPPLFLLDSAESGGIRWSEIWQEGLLIFSFWCILSPAEFGQSEIETGMVPGLAKWNDTEIRLFVWHMPIAKQAIIVKQTIVCLALFFSSPPPPAFVTATNVCHRRHLVTLTHHLPSLRATFATYASHGQQTTPRHR
jgi:hypothetical protein